eukprot:839062-Pelagomonas_calceolata.AAC.1
MRSSDTADTIAKGMESIGGLAGSGWTRMSGGGRWTSEPSSLFLLGEHSPEAFFSHFFKAVWWGPALNRTGELLSIHMARLGLRSPSLICNYSGGYGPFKSEPRYLDMYICDASQKTYHWRCMKERGCYFDEQRYEIDAADTCFACAGLSNAQKIDRECQSREEPIRVTWMPSWEPEETKEAWPKFQQHLLELEAKQSEPELS